MSTLGLVEGKEMVAMKSVKEAEKEEQPKNNEWRGKNRTMERTRNQTGLVDFPRPCMATNSCT